MAVFLALPVPYITAYNREVSEVKVGANGDDMQAATNIAPSEGGNLATVREGENRNRHLCTCCDRSFDQVHAIEREQLEGASE